MEQAKKKVLILGAKGMLGQELIRVFRSDEMYVVTAWDREDIDVTDFETLAMKLRELAPDIILNAVAYNAVDLCETDQAEYAKAKLLNVALPEKLALMSHKIGALLVHYSTDYVFDGANEAGYDETDIPAPLSRYGVTKRDGERAVLESRTGAYVIRLSKLFGNPATSALGKKSFFEVMRVKAEAGENQELTVVDDEKSCFTYAPDLAQATKELIEDQAAYGIYHLPNEGVATWYEAARELLALIPHPARLLPVSADSFPRPARRPHFSKLRNTKRPKLRPYTEALREYILGQ